MNTYHKAISEYYNNNVNQQLRKYQYFITNLKYAINYLAHISKTTTILHDDHGRPTLKDNVIKYPIALVHPNMESDIKHQIEKWLPITATNEKINKHLHHIHTQRIPKLEYTINTTYGKSFELNDTSVMTFFNTLYIQALLTDSLSVHQLDTIYDESLKYHMQNYLYDIYLTKIQKTNQYLIKKLQNTHASIKYLTDIYDILTHPIYTDYEKRKAYDNIRLTLNHNMYLAHTSNTLCDNIADFHINMTIETYINECINPHKTTVETNINYAIEQYNIETHIINELLVSIKTYSYDPYIFTNHMTIYIETLNQKYSSYIYNIYKRVMHEFINSENNDSIYTKTINMHQH